MIMPLQDAEVAPAVDAVENLEPERAQDSECEEGDLNPERDSSRGESHSRNSSTQTKASGGSEGRITDPVPAQLSLGFTPKIGTVPVARSSRFRRRR